MPVADDGTISDSDGSVGAMIENLDSHTGFRDFSLQSAPRQT